MSHGLLGVGPQINFRILPASTSYHNWVLRSETSPRQRDEDEFLCIPADVVCSTLREIWEIGTPESLTKW